MWFLFRVFRLFLILNIVLSLLCEELLILVFRLNSKLIYETRFTLENHIFFVKTYYREGLKAVLDKWCAELNSDQPFRRHIHKVITKFEGFGSVLDSPRSGRSVTAVTSENQQHIVEHLIENLCTLTRCGYVELNLSHTSYCRIVKRLKFKCYIPQLTYGLIEDDPERCLKFCELMLDEYRNNTTISDNILFSDEAQFKLNRLVNRRNSFIMTLLIHTLPMNSS